MFRPCFQRALRGLFPVRSGPTTVGVGLVDLSTFDPVSASHGGGSDKLWIANTPLACSADTCQVSCRISPQHFVFIHIASLPWGKALSGSSADLLLIAPNTLQLVRAHGKDPSCGERVGGTQVDEFQVGPACQNSLCREIQWTARERLSQAQALGYQPIRRPA